MPKKEIPIDSPTTTIPMNKHKFYSVYIYFKIILLTVQVINRQLEHITIHWKWAYNIDTKLSIIHTHEVASYKLVQLHITAIQS